MAQVITAELEALLVDKLQVGAKRHRGEIEIDVTTLGAAVDTSAVAAGDLVARYLFADMVGSPDAIESVASNDGTAEGDSVYNGCSLEVSGNADSTFRSSTDPALAPNVAGTLMAWASWPEELSALLRDFTGSGGAGAGWMLVGRKTGLEVENELQYRVGGTIVQTGLGLSFLSERLTHYALTWDATGSSLYINGILVYSGPAPGPTPIALPWVYGKNGNVPGEWWPGRIADMRIFDARLSAADVAEIAAGGSPCDDPLADTLTFRIQVASLGVDRSRKLAAAQLDALLDNESGARGWYTSGAGVFGPNNPVRAYAWYGDRDNRVQVFAGISDRVNEHRNPKTLTLKARSRMKWLLEQGFVAIGPQGVDDEGAIRTEDNGVYLNRSIEYIVEDILDRGGWPTADRAIATTGITLAEYVLADKGSWVDQIAGSDRLAAAAGCDFWDDETGIAHFEPSPLIAAVEPTPAWEFAAGVNVLALDHQVDDEARATRVEVSGPMTSAVPKWSQTWSTAKFDHPAGVWYDPADPDYIRVVDRVTKYIYRMKQSDRSIASKKYLGGYPLGLTGDPLDATHYYVLHAPWRNTGSTTGNSIREYDKATNALLATHALPNGRWSDLKTDGTNMWLTNYDDGKLYKRSMTGGAVSSHTITYGGDVQDQATGMWLLGTEIGLFFSDDKRFLIVDTSAPGTVIGVQSTKGTRIAGGERDTDTGIDLYAVAGAGSFGLTSGMVAKFTLAELVTNDVSALAVDFNLEDALGLQSGIADRLHEDCPNDVDPHPYEARLATVSMKVVQSLDQAQDVADAQLALLKRLRRVLDLATIGHPGIQINDPIHYLDDIAGIDSTWVIDSYRAQLSGSGTYTQTKSVLPWEAP